MDSFYGGRQGISFIIKERFESTAAMDDAFSNADYDKVWYGEYCIIDTINKNDINNGKIYKRTAYHDATNSDTHYSEYVGQIVGPAGGIPNVQLGNLETLQADFQALNLANGGYVYYYDGTNYTHESSTATTETNPTGTLSPIKDIKEITVGESTTVTSVIYKSGKDYAAGVTPALKYGFYTFQGIQKDIKTNEFPLSTIGLGFEIPYVDFDIDPAVTVTAYDQPATIIGNEKNKFYTNYHLTVPAGVPGRFISNITTTVPSNDKRYYKLTDIQDDNTISNTTQPTSISGIAKIAIGEVYYYDTIEEDNVSVIKPVSIKDPLDPTVTAYFWLWNVNEVNEINIATNTVSVSNFGQMTVSYTASNSVTYNLPLLRELTITHTENGPYMLQGYWGTSTDAVTIGQVAPEHWGVWATELTRTSSASYTEGQFDQEIPPGDTSIGNLGVYKYTDDNNIEVAEFYIGSNTGTETIWTKLGSDNSGSVNIKIENFNIKDTNNSVEFAIVAAPATTTPATWSENDAPWK